VGPVARSVRPFRPGYRRGWSGHPVSSSVQTGKDQVGRSPGQFVRSDPEIDQTRLVRSPGQCVRSDRGMDQVGPVARSVCPFRPGNRPGPVDRVRS
ncbi:LDHB, partial [Symbiodinium necroappetens]